MKALKRTSIILAALFALVLVFYAEENWRGKRAWEKCKAELEAKGAVLDWDKFIPPPVPDDQNFFKAPNMAEWFVGRGAAELSKRLQSTNEDLTTSVSAATNLIATPEIAKNYLSWSDQFEPDFDLMRAALKRPYARMDGDYSVPYVQPIPNFLAVRAVAQVLSQRAHCYFLLNEPEKALDELTLLNDSRRLLEGAPTGKPMTLVAAMINVAVTGLYADTIAEGFQRQVWQEPQLAVLQGQFKEINLPPIVASAFKMELASHIHSYAHTNGTTPASHYFTDLSGLYQMADLVLDDASASGKAKASAISRWLKYPTSLLLKFAPRGWAYQNVAYCAEIESKPLDGFDLEHDSISPRVVNEVDHNLNLLHRHKSPSKLLAAIVIPNTAKATQTLAFNQTKANEAQIACALERYRLAHGEYPGTLDAIVPQFIEKLPHDLIGGKPVIYRPTAEGKFLLYSIGWNETDDDGQDGGNDFTIGDWVWKNQPQMNTDSHR